MDCNKKLPTSIIEVINDLVSLIEQVQNGTYNASEQAQEAVNSHVNVEPCLSDVEMLAIAKLAYEAAVSYEKTGLLYFGNPPWEEVPYGDKSAMALSVMNIHRSIVNPGDGSAPSPEGSVCIPEPMPPRFSENNFVKFGNVQDRVFVKVAKVFVEEFRLKRNNYVYGNNGYYAQYPNVDGTESKV